MSPITSNNCNNVISPVCTVFVFFCWYSKKWGPRSCPELCQLKIEHFSPDVLKFNTKHEDNSFTLNFSTVPRTFLFIFHASLRGRVYNNFWNSNYKQKTAGSARFSRLSFCFLWLWLNWKYCSARFWNVHVIDIKMLIFWIIDFIMFVQIWFRPLI